MTETEIRRPSGLIVKLEMDPDPENPNQRDEAPVWLLDTVPGGVLDYGAPRELMGRMGPDFLRGQGDGSSERAKWDVFPVLYSRRAVVTLLREDPLPLNAPYLPDTVVLVSNDPLNWGMSTNLVAEAFVRMWNQYLGGDVWGYQIWSPCRECGQPQDMLTDCWGIYGREEAIEQAKKDAEDIEKRMERKNFSHIQ